MSMFPGPTPAYTNPTIEPENFQPSKFFISAISLGQTTTVTTSVNHNYVAGQQIRLLIPFAFGAQGLNNRSGFVKSIPSPTQVLTDIFSQGVDPFIASPPYSTTQPQIVAIGDVNSGVISSTGRVGVSTLIPGSFSNIS